MPLLTAHARRIGAASAGLMRRTDYLAGNAPRPLTRRERRSLDALIRQTRALEVLLRPQTRSDRAWEFYDKDEQDLERYLDPRGHSREGYATGKVQQMLQMVQGAAERAPIDLRPWPLGVSALARAASGKRSSETADARAVLNDLLEERGYGDIAALVRLDDRGVDRFLLPYLRGEFFVIVPTPRGRS